MTDKTIQKILEACERGDLATDSDIEDFVRANRLKFDDVLRCLANHMEVHKPCWGCKHILNRVYRDTTATVCNTCSRVMVAIDNYSPDKKRYRAKDPKPDGCMTVLSTKL